MKKLLVILFLVSSYVSFSQGQPTALPTLFNGKFYQYTQYLAVDSGLFSPRRDTNFVPKQGGCIIFRTADSTLYVYKGGVWKGIGSGNGTGVYNSGYGLILSNGKFSVDTLYITTRLRLMKSIDSLASLTQKNISVGYGLNFISNNLSIDSFSVATRPRVQKSIDSVNVILNQKFNTSTFLGGDLFGFLPNPVVTGIFNNPVKLEIGKNPTSMLGFNNFDSIKVFNNSSFQKWLSLNRDRNYFTDYIGIISYGQSNSTASEGNIIVTPNQTQNNLMLNTGLATPTGSISTSLVPLVESVTESPMSGLTETFNEELSRSIYRPYFNSKTTIIGSIAGIGGNSISELNKGGGIGYSRFLWQASQMKKLTDVANKTFQIPFIPFIQGEQDQAEGKTKSYYTSQLNSLINNLNTSIDSLTQQKEQVPLIATQLAWGVFPFVSTYASGIAISESQYENALTNPWYVVACPTYQLQYLRPDGIHYTASDRKKVGAYIALAAKKTIVDKKKFIPMHPTKLTVVGNEIQVEFYAPKYPIILDDSVFNSGNYGFKVVTNVNDTTTIPITSVKVLGDRTVSITCASNPVGSTLFYAVNPSEFHQTTSDTSITFASSGCLHDSQTDYVVEGTTLYNWCLRFNMQIFNTQANPLYATTNNSIGSVVSGSDQLSVSISNRIATITGLGTGSTPTFNGLINNSNLNQNGSFNINNGNSIFTYNSSAELSGVITSNANKDLELSAVGKIKSNNLIEAPIYKLSALNTAPSSSTDIGTTGEVRITSTYIYVCIATNTWVRAALSTW